MVGGKPERQVAVWLVEQKLLRSAVAVVVIDVVEGSATAALPQMIHFVRSRPVGFHSLDSAVRWCTRSGQTKNREVSPARHDTYRSIATLGCIGRL